MTSADRIIRLHDSAEDEHPWGNRRAIWGLVGFGGLGQEQEINSKISSGDYPTCIGIGVLTQTIIYN
jgi:hypothetical protein